NGRTDIFLATLSGTTVSQLVRVNLGPGNTEAVGGDSRNPSINPAFGYEVAYESDATNLVSGDTNGLTDVFVSSVSSGSVTTNRISVSAGGAEALGGSSVRPSLHFGVVAFESSAANLVPGDTNTCPGFPAAGTCPDIFVRYESQPA